MTSSLLDAVITARAELTGRRAAVSATYTVLATVMIWSRFAGIGESLWHDEIFTVEHYVAPGPAASFGHYGTNDHILLSVLAWLTVYLPGFSEWAIRFWSVVPFVSGAAIVTVWLHRRAGASVALFFGLLSTSSSQLLMLSTEARGYGLAFMAMAVMTVAAYEASVQSTSNWLSLFAVAGVIGCWTLPTFVLPLLGASGVLLGIRSLRRRLLLRLAIAFCAVVGWYAVPASALIASRGQQYGAPLPWHAPLTGGATELVAAFIPTLSPASLIPAIIVLPVLVVGLVRLRRVMPGLAGIAVAPVTFTFLALTIGGFFVDERFVSYLLVPIFVIAAFGLAALLTPRLGPRGVLAAAYTGSLVMISVVVFAIVSVQHARMPQEANREAANAVAAAMARTTRPVIFNTAHPQDILHYLPGSVPMFRAAPNTLGAFICSRHFERTGLVFVQQPYGIDVADTSCLARRGATVRVFRQWDRGLRIAVWTLPPKS
jgi:hypothetical protein